MGGKTAAFKADIAPIYNTVRYDLDSYDLVVPNGSYSVTLQFNEPAYSAAGKRVFGVTIQGRQVVTGLDIFARVGQHTALDLAFPDVAVADGTLHIDFTKEVEFPCIAGIVVSGQTAPANQLAGAPFTRKINCGGDAVGDYEADRVSGGAPPAAAKDRAMPVEDFYLDYARANFGPAVAEPVGRLLARIDGVQMPEVSAWIDGPGGLSPSSAAWSEVKPRFAFVGELEQLRPQVQGAGNLDRFDYWLNTYQAAATMAELGCLRGQLDKAMAAGDHASALTARIAMAQAWTRLLTLQTAIVTTPGELGTIANLEQHTRRSLKFLEGHDDALTKALGKPLPPEAEPGKGYAGPAKIIVPTVRSVARLHESLKLTVLILDQVQPVNVKLHFRAMGHGDWRESPAEHVGRAVYRVSLPALQEDTEYYVSAERAAGQTLSWPATAPHMNQTVVVWDTPSKGL
jgi:hypothetical protein